MNGKGDTRRKEDDAKLEQQWPKLDWDQPPWVPPPPRRRKTCGCRPGATCEECE